ncbi:glycosyltransferase family 4 protein [Flavobacteriaceae bacterium]|nr:glycosyltransferase family 4 protein [Flavobacteriaceae bacterium]
MSNNQKKIVFLCGARDFHAMDWYRSAEERLPNKKLCILTDLIAGEGFQKLISEKDNIYFLIILDKFLFNRQSNIGNLWRNILKLLVLPIQIILLKRFDKKNPNSIYYAHSMYYLWLAAAANVKFIGTPQGSDVLIKPFKSRFFKTLSIWAMKSAKHVTVDSEMMRDKVFEISRVEAKIIQNGIDIRAIEGFLSSILNKEVVRNRVVSIRGFSPLYRIEQFLIARSKESNPEDFPISLIYPFYENEYKQKAQKYLTTTDEDLGRVNKNQMYELLFESKLVISIPSSDSSPRSVYESIFCGCAVAITHHPYYDILPICMKERIILINIDNKNWFTDAIEKADTIINSKFSPSEEALDIFDQRRCFNKILNLIND